MSPRSSVLVVDDDQDTLDCLEAALRDEFEVVTARTCLSALDVARARGVDVVLLDVALPGIDGLDVLRWLRHSDAAPEVIVLSRIDNIQVVVTAVQYGAADYVTKPFDVAELRRTILKACERRQHPPVSAPAESMAGRHAAGAVLIVAADIGGLAPVAIALAGHVVTRLASSAQAALALFAELTPALVVLDVSLPHTEWHEVLSTIRVSARHCHILVKAATEAAPDGGPLPAGPDVTVIRPRDLGELLDRIAALQSEATGPLRLPRYRPPVLRAIEFMAARHAASIGAAEIARAARLSPRHLADVFRADTGFTIGGYLTRFRVEVAKCLLVAEDTPLEQVARRAGFGDASHLSRVFVRAVGQRPGQYRRRRVPMT